LDATRLPDGNHLIQSICIEHARHGEIFCCLPARNGERKVCGEGVPFRRARLTID
jgi:hypothetical protein